MQPAVSVQGLGGPLGVPQVSPEHTGAAHADLTGRNTEGWSAPLTTAVQQRRGLAHLSFPVLGVVIHVGYVHQLHHGAGQGGADVACGSKRNNEDVKGTESREKVRFRRRDSSTCAPVSRHGEGASRRAFCLSVALKDEAAQSGSEEGQHGGGDGGRGRQGEAQVPSKTGLKQEKKHAGRIYFV